MDRLWVAVRREPVRLYLYGVLATGEALAAAYGLVAADKGALWLGLGAAALVVPAAETARRKVTPAADPRDDAGRVLRVPPEVRDATEPPPPPGVHWS